jgi:predicted site-specific integrase-resolvase
MAIRIDGQTYYRTTETCLKAGISRATLFRWLKVGIVEDVMIRDRKGWRLFTHNDINRIKDEASRVSRGGAIL